MGWDDVVNPGGGDRLDIIALEVGENKVRFLDAAPVARNQVWIHSGATNFPISLKPTDAIPKRIIDALPEDSKPQKRHFIRLTKTQKDGSEKAGFYVGSDSLFSLIKAFATNPEYGDIRNYPWEITRVGTDRNSTRYTPMPGRNNSEMTAAQKAVANELFNKYGPDLDKAVPTNTLKELEDELVKYGILTAEGSTSTPGTPSAPANSSTPAPSQPASAPTPTAPSNPPASGPAPAGSGGKVGSFF